MSASSYVKTLLFPVVVLVLSVMFALMMFRGNLVVDAPCIIAHFYPLIGGVIPICIACIKKVDISDSLNVKVRLAIYFVVIPIIVLSRFIIDGLNMGYIHIIFVLIGVFLSIKYAFDTHSILKWIILTLSEPIFFLAFSFYSVIYYVILGVQDGII